MESEKTMEEETEKIVDVESWKGSSEKVSYKDIILKQISRITTISSKELTHGWWKKGLVAGGSYETILQYISDGRESYSRAVEVLHDLLAPKFDKEMEAASTKLNKQLANLYDKYVEKEEKEKYRNERLELQRFMFQYLCKFCERKNWFAETSEED